MALPGVRGEGLRWPSPGFRREPVIFFQGLEGAGLQPGSSFSVATDFRFEESRSTSSASNSDGKVERSPLKTARTRFLRLPSVLGLPVRARRWRTILLPE